jgi:hypothetical protein
VEKKMQQIDHRIIKLLIGVIALSIALLTQLVSGQSLGSISEAYYFRSRDWFVGLLFAVGFLFISFKGLKDRPYERLLTLAACLLAVTVATVPCNCKPPTTGSAVPIHFLAAVLLFVILGYFCWRFRKTAKEQVSKYPEAAIRVRVYSACLVGMIGCGVMTLIYAFAKERIDLWISTWVFWTEFIGLCSFGISWLAASRVFPYVTNSRERFHLWDGCAADDNNEPTAFGSRH